MRDVQNHRATENQKKGIANNASGAGEAAPERLKDAQDASDKAWQDMQKGYIAACDAIAVSFKEAMGRFK
jgi:hypothetical protein